MRLRTTQHGLTIVELMIAVVLGMVLSAAVLGVYINSSRSVQEVERYAQMQENGRFALALLADDLAMVDFWGHVISVEGISTAINPTAGDCGEGISLYNTASGVFANDYHDAGATDQFTLCNAIANEHYAGTDIVAIKRVSGSPTARTFTDTNDIDDDGIVTESLTVGVSDLQLGVVYLRSNGVSGYFMDNASGANAPILGETDWQYLPRIYFIRKYFNSVGDGTPTLCRRELLGRNLSDTICLAEGVEDLRLQFGIDTSGDGIPDRYLPNPTLPQMENAVAARIFLLARSRDQDPAYNDVKVYNLGDVSVGPFNDGHYRSVFTSTVALRNTASLAQWK